MSQILNALNTTLKDRIMVLDGAYGTLLQAHGLKEDDYRGVAFAGHNMPSAKLTSSVPHNAASFKYVAPMCFQCVIIVGLALLTCQMPSRPSRRCDGC